MHVFLCDALHDMMILYALYVQYVWMMVHYELTYMDERCMLI